MASTSGPDLSTLHSAADVFDSTRTLPQIRTIHRSLHVQIDDKASRLRTQVGSSYRELLGTADSIVQMRQDNDAVQALLGRMGGRCGRAVVGGKVAGLGHFVSDPGDADGRDREMGDVARAKLLEGCVLVVGRVLKGGGGTAVGHVKMTRGDELLLASKVLVLSRLLGKSFDQEGGDGEEFDSDVSVVVESAKKSLWNLRQRLLRGVNRVLERTSDGGALADVLKALCAYSLATSSGAKDVLWHFLHVRRGAIVTALDAEESSRQRQRRSNSSTGVSNNVIKALTLYTRTLLDVQALVPSKLADALASLKKRPLLSDDTLKQLEGLRLDIYERWCGDEIKFFTPFLRHDDLGGPQARDMLASWADKDGEVLVAGLKTAMERMTEFKAIAELRTSVLQLWIRDGGKARGFDPSEMLDSLRCAINGHMLQILELKVNKLHLVASEVSGTLDAWQDGVTDQQDALWAGRDLDAELSLGVNHFLQHVTARLDGRNDPVSRTVHCFSSWRQVVDDVGDMVEQLKKQRWDNDADEIEDEETIEARQQLLSRDDPKALSEKLNSLLDQAFEELDGKLLDLWKSHADGPNHGKVAVYMLRILRDVRANLPKLDSKSVKRFGLGIVPSLHGKLSETVTVAPLETFTSQVLTQTNVLGRTLWEGSPELPTQPSHRAFKFLRDVSHSMGDAGMDLWSPAAVHVMRKRLREETCKAWLEAMETRGLGGQKAANGGGAGGGKTSEKKQKKKKGNKKKAGDKTDQEDENKAEPVGGEVHQEEVEKGADGEKEALQIGESESEDAEQQTRDLFIQWLFDMSLLRCAYGRSLEDSEDEYAKLQDKCYERTGLNSAEAWQRIVKSSQDYWKKTGLLFGLLSS